MAEETKRGNVPFYKMWLHRDDDDDHKDDDRHHHHRTSATPPTSSLLAQTSPSVEHLSRWIEPGAKHSQEAGGRADRQADTRGRGQATVLK